MQYPQYPNLTVPAVPTVPCSTRGYCRSTQVLLLARAVPTVPTVPCSTQLSLFARAVRAGTAAVPNCHFESVQYPQYPAVHTHWYCRSTQLSLSPLAVPTVPTVPCSTNGYCGYCTVPASTCKYPQYPTVPICSTHSPVHSSSQNGYCAVPARVTGTTNRGWYAE
jgi:hypothetical protein